MSARFLFSALFQEHVLSERLSFDKLMGLSDPKRIARASTVRIPPVRFDTYKDNEAYYFNAKSSPSTTGLRHKGYVRVFKPKNPNTPLEKCECEVDCGCPDYKFRWAWANKQRGSSQVGPKSLNQAWNKAPRVTNPSGKPGLCKHVIATRDYIYGQFRSFASDQERDETTVDKLDRLVAQSTKRWADFPGEVQKARERDRKIKQGIERAAYIRSNPSALDLGSPSARPLSPSPALGKALGAKEAGVSPSAAGSEVAARAAQAAGDQSVAAWRAKRSEESAPPPSLASVVSGMTNSMDHELGILIEEMESGGLGKATLGKPGHSPTDGESEELKMLREIREIVRRLAGDDLPPDMAREDTPPEEPGIPLDAAEARDQN